MVQGTWNISTPQNSRTNLQYSSVGPYKPFLLFPIHVPSETESVNPFTELERLGVKDKDTSPLTLWMEEV